MKDKTFYTIINICAVIALIMIAIVTASLTHHITSCTTNDTTYTMQAKVIDVDTVSDTVQIEDSHGEVWEFFGTENFQKGNSVIVLMDDQSTSSVYDDTILSVRLDPFVN
jgi:hypothetical protein